MNLNLKTLFDDHVDSLLFMHIQLGCIIATDKQWSNIVAKLSSHYKFTLTRDSFTGSLIQGVAVFPLITEGLTYKGDVELCVSYEFSHNQDAAVIEAMEVYRQKLGLQKIYGNIYTDITHRLSTVKANVGMITLPKDVFESIKPTWKALAEYKLKHKTDQYIKYLEDLK